MFGLFNKSNKDLTPEEKEWHVQELLLWQPPDELFERFAYHQSGVDPDGCPVWVLEGGQWDIRSFVEEGGPLVPHFERYHERGIREMQMSPKSFPDPTDKFCVIDDLAGYDSRQLANFESAQKIMSITRNIRAIIPKVDNLKWCIIVNAPPIFEVLWKIISPILGPIMDKIAIYGPNRKIWEPELHKLVDPGQLPPSLGGTKNL